MKLAALLALACVAGCAKPEHREIVMMPDSSFAVLTSLDSTRFTWHASDLTDSVFVSPEGLADTTAFYPMGDRP